MKKKILIFSLQYHPFIGGAEVALKEITDRISPDEIEFHMVTNRFDTTLPKIEKIGNVLVHRIGIATKKPEMKNLRKFPLHLNKALFQFTAARKASELHKKYNYNAVWSMMAHGAGIPGGLFKKKHPNAKYILTLQEGDPPEYIEKKMKPFGKLFQEVFTRADTIQVISTFLGKWARRMGYAGKIELIPNAVNTEHFSQTYPEEVLKPIREKLQKKEKDVFMITTSRLVKKNACDDVIKALPHLPEAVKFIILGTGPDEDMLRALAQELGVASRVQFVGFVDHKEMPKYLKVSDIFIRPSLSEGFGSSFVEAFAAEIPVIATQEGGIADFLFDPERNPKRPATGRAVDARDPEGIARAVKLFIKDTAATERIVKNAKELAFSHYDWDSIAKDMRERVFEAVLL